MYYVEYCRWGVNVFYESMNGNAFGFYAFDSKKKRDAWVEDHEWDGYPNRTAENLEVDITNRTEFHDLPQIVMMIWNNFTSNGMEPVNINKMMDGCEIDMNSLVPYRLDVKKKDGCLWAMPRIVNAIYRDYDII